MRGGAILAPAFRGIKSMKMHFCAALFAAATGLAGMASAYGADMPVKAPKNALFSGYPYNGSGFYWGVGAQAAGETPTINGTAVASGDVFGGALGGIAGYQYGRGNVAYAFEVGAYWQNTSADFTCVGAAACTVGSKVELVQRVKAMTPLSSLTSLLPGFGTVAQPALPVLPANVTVTNMHPYLMASLHETEVSAAVGVLSSNKWQIRPGFGVGTISQLSNSAAVDVFAEYLPPTSRFNLGVQAPGGVAMGASTGAKYVVGTSLLW